MSVSDHDIEVREGAEGWVGYCLTCRHDTKPHTTETGAYVSLWAHHSESNRRLAAAGRRR